MKLQRFPADSLYEAMPWMGYALKGVCGAKETGWKFKEADGESGSSDSEEIYPGGPDENVIAVHHDARRVIDYFGEDRGTVRAREAPDPFPPFDHSEQEAAWRAKSEQYADDAEPETKRRCLADNQKRLEFLRAVLEEDQNAVHDIQYDIYLRCSFLDEKERQLKLDAELNCDGEARSEAGEIRRSEHVYLEKKERLRMLEAEFNCHGKARSEAEEIRRSEQALWRGERLL